MSDERVRRVVVLHQYALPRSEGGATRHVELFSRVSDGGGRKTWSSLIVAGDINLYTRQRFRFRSNDFVAVRVPAHAGNGPKRILSWMSYALSALVKGLTGPRPDVVYASSPQMLVPLVGWFIARVRRAALVVEIRDLWPRSLVEFGFLREGSRLHRILARLERFFCTRADRIVVVTSGWEEHLTSLGVDLSRVEVISNGADPADFESSLSRAEARARLELPADGCVAVFAGAHGPKDGLDVVLDAAAHTPDTTFLLVGDGQEKVRLKERAAAEGLANVRFHDPVPKDRLPDLFQACDIGLHIVAPTELFEQAMSPNKLYDYMAAGLPAISNAGGVVEKLLAENGAGISASVAHIDDADAGKALAEAVAQLWSLPAEELEAYGERGRQYMDEHASRTAMAARLSTLLEEVAPARGRRTRTQPSEPPQSRTSRAEGP